ncbi:MAG: hypothetical protein IKB96_02270 [Prevotella sp.]|nr:hypothetical protein [Prevotella sp.]
MKNIVIKSLLAVSILACGICFTGCGNVEEVETEVTQVNLEEQEQAEKYEKYGVIYYVDAEITDTEVFDGVTNVWCLDAFGEHYVFHGEGFEVGDKVQLEVGDNNTENDGEDDIIIDVRVY